MNGIQGGIAEMEQETGHAETDDAGDFEREVSVSRYPGRGGVTVRTTRLPGEEPSRGERMRARLRRLALEGRITPLRG